MPFLRVSFKYIFCGRNLNLLCVSWFLVPWFSCFLVFLFLGFLVPWFSDYVLFNFQFTSADRTDHSHKIMNQKERPEKAS